MMRKRCFKSWQFFGGTLLEIKETRKKSTFCLDLQTWGSVQLHEVKRHSRMTSLSVPLVISDHSKPSEVPVPQQIAV